MSVQKTCNLVQEWIRAKQQMERQKRDMAMYEEALNKSINELGAWLVPDNQENGNWFNIWHGSGILQARRLRDSIGNITFEVSWRKEPDGKDRYENGV